MKLGTASLLLVIPAALLFSLTCAGDQCKTKCTITIDSRKTSLKVPVLSVALKLIKAIGGPALPPGVEPKFDVSITLSATESLNVDLACSCIPPCEPRAVQYARVGFEGTTSAFGGRVEWEEELWSCEPSDPVLPKEAAQTVHLLLSKSQGRGRLVSTEASMSLLFVSLKEQQSEMAFTCVESCECRSACPSEEGNHAPTVDAPAALSIIRGEPLQFSITARDRDGDLMPNCVKYTPASNADGVAVTPLYGGNAGGRRRSSSRS